jgi:hypothetical protein
MMNKRDVITAIGAVFVLLWSGFVISAYYVVQKPLALQVLDHLLLMAWTVLVTSMLLINAFALTFLFASRFDRGRFGNGPDHCHNWVYADNQASTATWLKRRALAFSPCFCTGSPFVVASQWRSVCIERALLPSGAFFTFGLHGCKQIIRKLPNALCWDCSIFQHVIALILNRFAKEERRITS